MRQIILALTLTNALARNALQINAFRCLRYPLRQLELLLMTNRASSDDVCTDSFNEKPRITFENRDHVRFSVRNICCWTGLNRTSASLPGPDPLLPQREEPEENQFSSIAGSSTPSNMYLAEIGWVLSGIRWGLAHTCPDIVLWVGLETRRIVDLALRQVCLFHHRCSWPGPWIDSQRCRWLIVDPHRNGLSIV